MILVYDSISTHQKLFFSVAFVIGLELETGKKEDIDQGMASWNSIPLEITYQVLLYLMQRGDQTVSKTSLAIVVVVRSIAGVCFFVALPTHSWLWLIHAFMNFKRKNADGFSIGNSWVNFSGNVGKLLVALMSIFFDIVFMSQRFLLYGAQRVMVPSKTSKEEEPLIKCVDHPKLENV
ncbi:Lysosomal cystine transporter [Parasponia andersonii]|uniref:Lysosomal cystine transporter n=1 Tax=Parasponia andersonii TaxID=3476 RepID=A0A2P5B5I4_PARAD|nr:Lysosomal cystine transporter [Parasponia andersonii]